MAYVNKRYCATIPTRYTLWVKKRDQEGRLCWYPKRSRIGYDTLMDVQAKAEIDYGIVNFYLLPEGTKPPESDLDNQEAQVQKVEHYAVWAQVTNSDKAHKLQGGMTQKDAEGFQQLIASQGWNTKTWIEKEKQ